MRRNDDPANMLHDIAHAYQQLDHLVAAGSAPGTGTTSAVFGARMPVNAHVIDVRVKLERWIHFLARWLMEEVTIERHTPTPWADAGTHAGPWEPPTTDTADLAHHLADWRIGHFTHHADEQLRLEFLDDLHEHRSLALRTAWPTGARRIDIGIRCNEYFRHEDTPCPGRFTATIQPNGGYTPDLLCSHNRDHAVPPSDFRTLARRVAMTRAIRGTQPPPTRATRRATARLVHAIATRDSAA